MKINDNIVKEYVRRLNEDELRFLQGRFTTMLCGDKGDIVDRASQNKEMDRLFAMAVNADELYDIIDLLGEVVKKESSRRFGDRKE